MKVVINACFGGFAISEAAYSKLIEWGIPVRRYGEETRDPNTGLYSGPKGNEGMVIFDRELTPAEDRSAVDEAMTRLAGRYWAAWLDRARSHPLLVRLVEELGEAVNGPCAKLKVIEVPDGVEWEVSEYDGYEKVEEVHRSWA